MKMTKSFSFLAAVCLMTGVNACGPSLNQQARIDFDNQIKSIKTIGLVEPDILIYELSAGGERELIDEWVESAARNFSNVLKKELQTRDLKVKTVRLDGSADDKEIPYLFRAITGSLQWNKTYRKLSVCEDERICKDFSFGPVEHLFNKHKIDALLVMFGVNNMETAGRTKARKRSRALTALVRFAAVGSRLPVIPVIAPLAGPGTYLSMALIDRSGSVVWYTGAASHRPYDLRDESRVDEVAKRMLRHIGGNQQE